MSELQRSTCMLVPNHITMTALSTVNWFGILLQFAQKLLTGDESTGGGNKLLHKVGVMEGDNTPNAHRGNYCFLWPACVFHIRVRYALSAFMHGKSTVVHIASCDLAGRRQLGEVTWTFFGNLAILIYPTIHIATIAPRLRSTYVART